MSTYRVLTASLYRNSGLLGVEVEQIDFGGGRILEVEGQPGKCVQFRTARPVYDDTGKEVRRIIIIEPPDFPIEELKGQRLIAKPRIPIGEG